jgi:hypothetical protein
MLIGDSTATWVFDTETGVASMTSGTYVGMMWASRNPSSHVFTHTMTYGSIGGSLAATAATWSCSDGTFLSSSSVCGGYSFGDNYIDESAYTPTATGGTVIIGGDDYFHDPSTYWPLRGSGPQTLNNQYDSLMTSAVSGAGAGFQRWQLINGVFGGYRFNFDVAVVPVPPAIYLFGSALSLMGVLRRKISS